MKVKVSFEFASYTDPGLIVFGGNSATKLDGNPAFPTPPVTPADVKTQVDDFQASCEAAQYGGIQLTAAKKAKRDLLLDSLYKNGYYVQTIAGKNLDVLLTSGYFAISNNRAPSPLDPPSIAELSHLASTQLLLRLFPIANARSYQVQISTETNPWQDAGLFLQARRIVLANLTPGTIYNVRARAIGGSTGASDWSNPSSLMAT
jgi:hypothetical protein